MKSAKLVKFGLLLINLSLIGVLSCCGGVVIEPPIIEPVIPVDAADETDSAVDAPVEATTDATEEADSPLVIDICAEQPHELECLKCSRAKCCNMLEQCAADTQHNCPGIIACLDQGKMFSECGIAVPDESAYMGVASCTENLCNCVL